MKTRGDLDDDIALCVLIQLRELNPTCNRYRDVFFWARQNLDKRVLELFGFGLIPSLPFPIGMRDTRCERWKGKRCELYYPTSEEDVYSTSNE